MRGPTLSFALMKTYNLIFIDLREAKERKKKSLSPLALSAKNGIVFDFHSFYFNLIFFSFSSLLFFLFFFFSLFIYLFILVLSFPLFILLDT